MSQLTAEVNRFVQVIFISHRWLPLVTGWALMCAMPGFVSDADPQSVPAVAAKHPPEGDWCLVGGLGFRARLGFLKHSCF